MQTSLNKIKAIDDYLLNKMSPAESILFEANMLINAELSSEVAHQESVHRMIKAYGRQCLRAEIIAVQNRLLREPAHKRFMQQMISLFKKH